MKFIACQKFTPLVNRLRTGKVVKSVLDLILIHDADSTEIQSKFKLIVKVIGIRPLAPVQNSVSLKLMQRKTLNFVVNLPDVENITK